MTQKRLEILKKSLVKNDLDALLVTKKENIFYLTGFEGEGLLLVKSNGDTHFITDTRFAQQIQDEFGNLKIAIIKNSWVQTLKEVAKKSRVKYLGFESEWFSHQNVSKLTSAVKVLRLIPQIGTVENIRIIKDTEEIDLIKKSVYIIEKTFFHIKKILRPSLTEEGLSIKIDTFMRSQGAERCSFKTIVAGGSKSSYPHPLTSRKRLGDNNPILVDMGCVYKGYHSDLTRMFFTGKISAKFRSIYSIVKKAQSNALKNIKPGVCIAEIDTHARKYITSKGLGKFFIHGLGHGIGLEIHEPPSITKRNRNLLRSGMVFTVEPGIYIPGWGGVRLEDMILVTDKGCEVLTKNIPR